MSDNKKVNKLLGEVSKKYGISKEQLESAAQSGNIENLLKNTNPNQSKQIESVLSDPEKAKKLLQSPNRPKITLCQCWAVTTQSAQLPNLHRF